MLKRTFIYVFLVLIALFFYDSIVMHSSSTVEGTYRLESEFDAVSGATTAVSIVPSDYDSLSSPESRTSDALSDAQIKEMVATAIELQGGLDDVISKGDQVLIKVNLVGADEPAGTGENTDYRVVKGLLQCIYEYTGGDVELIVAEGTARENDDPDEAESVWDNSGYVDMLTDTAISKMNVKLLNLNQTIDSLVEVDLKDDATAAPHEGVYMVHKAVLQADVYISVPVLKIHNTGITNALKNQIGIAPGCYYGYNKCNGTEYYDGLVHDVDQRRWTTEEIVDFCNIADIDFVVVDALMCLELQKTDKETNRVRMNMVMAGQDPVAVDHVAAQVFCLNPDDIAHITLAEKMGLGTNDDDQIYVEGVSVDDVKEKVEKSTANEGVFGQSNRTWILSQAYSDADIDSVCIESEANFIPTAGKDGWSEPVYFFDDRIDLLSYYEEETDMVSYAFTYFDAPEAQTAELWLGNDEGIWVYLNGELVYDFSSITSFDDDELWTDVVDVDLLEGENSLLVKTYNNYGDYSFTLNICDPETSEQWEGSRVAGLKFYENSDDDDNDDDDDSTSAIAAIQQINTISAYPNPCTDKVRIVTGEKNNTLVNVVVYDMQGKVVKKITESDYSWDLTAESGQKIPAGQYFVKDIESNSVRCIVVK